MIALAGDASLNDDDQRRLVNPVVGGIILFSRNFVSSAQLRCLTADIRRRAGRPILIAVDQEGGRVQRFCHDSFTTIPPMQTLAVRDDAATCATAAGVVLAAELLAHGIDLTFAPVLDIAYGHCPVIGQRAFSADPMVVAELGLQVAAGLRAAGMVACGKHFPGHGYVSADSHLELPVDERSYEQLAAADLIPFSRFVDAGFPLLMTAHICYPAIDERVVTFSSFWLQQVLRRQLGFRGQIVSDDLTMAGASIGDSAARLQAASAAGCDLFLVCDVAAIDEAIAATTVMTTNQPTDKAVGWSLLRRSHTHRIGIGDLAYRQARTQVETISNG